MVGKMQKKALAILLALIMVFGQTLTGVLTLTASADTTYYVTLTDEAVVGEYFLIPNADLFGTERASVAEAFIGISRPVLTGSDPVVYGDIAYQAAHPYFDEEGSDSQYGFINGFYFDEPPEYYFIANSVGTYTFTVEYLDDNTGDHDFYYVTLNVGVGTNTAPTATDVTVGGTAKVGQTLAGDYTYYDADSNAESGSTYKWYRATDNTGTGAAAIDGAAADTYVLTSDDLDKYVCFEVTPKDGTDYGTAVKSSYVGPVAAADSDATETAKIYYTESQSVDGDNATYYRLRRANLSDGSSAETLYWDEIGTPEGVAVDVDAGYVYFSDPHESVGKIYRVNLDGTNMITLISGVYANDIAIDTVHGKIYYTESLQVGEDNTTYYRLRWANLSDGSSAETLYWDELGTPEGVAVDPDAGYVYFSDPHESVGKIYRTDLDGSNMITLISGVYANDIAIDTVHGKIYYTESQSTYYRLRRASLSDGSSAETLYLDGPGTPEGVAVDPDAGYVYFSDPHESVGEIYRANLDGTNMITLISGAYANDVAIPIASASSDTTAPAVTDTAITASNLTITGVTLSWNKATDETSAQTALEYLVYRSSSNNLDTVTNIEANGTAVGSYAADIATKDITGLSAGTTYYFNVIVKDEAGNKTCYTTESVTTPVGLELGSAALTGDKYYYPNVAVSGSNIKTILIAFSDNVISGDQIVLPTAPAGFTVSSTSNDYTKRINLAEGALTSAVQDYLRAVGFAVASDSQTVNITVTTENITTDIFYNSDTEHYYQFLPAGEWGIDWVTAYTTAKGMTYMGRTGYLATVTTLSEDTFLNSLSGGSTGWLGGTILSHGTLNGLYYDSFQTASFVTNGWYWACGPEIGDLFYNVTTLTDASPLETVDAENASLGYYFNWGRGNEPNNTAGGENCLTTLVVSGSPGKQGTVFSWNDISYDLTDPASTYSAKGYFVEYGNQLTGDDGSGSAAFASAIGELAFLSTDATLKASSTVKGATVALGTPNGTLGSETAGSVMLTWAQATDISNTGSYITLFDTNEDNAVVKAVKYASGASTANFATDTAYANEAVSNGDFFIVRVTAQDGTTVNYYRINVMVDPTLTISGVGIYTNGFPIIIAAGTSGTLIYFDGDADGEIDEGETPVILAGPSGNNVDGYNLSSYDIYGTALWSSVASSKVTMLGGRVNYIFGAGAASGVNVTGNTDITVKGGIVFMLYGGGNYGAVGGNTNITVTGGTILGGIVGGCGAGTVSGSTNITITGGANIGTKAYNANIYGGGYGGTVSNNANMTLTGGTINGSVYGGGYNASVLGTATVTVGVDAGITTGIVSHGTCIGGTVGAGSKVIYEVAFYSESGGTKYSSDSLYPAQWITENALATEPATDPTQTGMVFSCWKKVSDNSVYSFDSTVSAATKLYSAFLSTDATLKTSSTIKGETVSLGTPNSTMGSETAGSVMLTWAQATDTSNTGSYITLFDTNEDNAVVKAVKYASGASTVNFATDTAYANEAVSNGDFFIVRVTAQDGTTVNYYRINVMVEPTLTIGGTTAIYTNGFPIIIAAGTSGTLIYFDEDADGEIDEGETPVILAGPSGNNVAGYNLSGYDIYGTAVWSSVASSKITMLGGRVNYIFGAGQNTNVNVTGNTDITVKGGAITMLYGGGSGGSVGGNINVTVTGGTITYGIVGGCSSGTVAGDTNITITGGTMNGDVSGGGCGGTVFGNANVTITGGTTNGNVYGGGWSGSVIGTATVTVGVDSGIAGTVSSGCRDEGPTVGAESKVIYEVAFYDENGGTKYDSASQYPSQWITEGYKATEPATDPTLTGMAFSCWKKVSDDSAYSFDSTVSAATKLYSAFLSTDATLKTTSTVKGETASLGTPAGTLGSETAGSVMLTSAQAADTSNTGSYITLFDKNDGNATVKAVKYASGASTANFASDTAYANEAISNGDFFIVRVTAQDGVTINYYRINVIVTATVELTNVTWKSGSTYTCGITMSSPCRIITISVNSGYFTVPSLGSGVLTFLGGTNGTTYINSYSAGQQFNSVVFSFTDIPAAETLLSNIVYSLNGTAQQTITATASSVSPEAGDTFFDGHFYRYVATPISWVDAALAAGSTADPYFGGRGYLATATSQAENSILLKLVDTGGTGDDHWNDAWMGGLWQRNTGTVSSPSITRGTDGNEISYSDLCDTTFTEQKNLLPHYVTLYSTDAICNGTTSYIYQHPETVLYYWIDGPEAGQEIANNVTDGFSPWHSGEPNTGDFVYIGLLGPYWDDLSAYDGSSFAKLSGYIVEFSGFGEGGSTEGIVASDTKIMDIDTTAPSVTDKTITSSNITRTGATLSWNKATDDCSTQADLEYLVYRSTSNNLGTVTDIEANGTALGSYAADIATKDATVLTAGTTYYFNVVVKDMAGNKICYTTKSVTTLPPITAAITPAEALTEENLDANSLTVALSNVTFKDATLDEANFTLNNAPAGVSVESVEYTDTTHCKVSLAYSGTDFDSNVTTFSLTIKIAELSDNDGDLTSNELTITALVETAPTVTTDSVTTYTATTAVFGGDVTASGGESVTERGIVYSSTDSTPEIGETGVTKNDNGSGMDTFSETITGLAQGTKYYVRAYAINIEGTSYGSVEEFTTLVITSAITPAEALTEENLDANSLTVALSNVTFKDATLDKANFTLNNAPAGVSVEGVEYTDTTHCKVNLAYDDTDFDSNVTTFSLTIAIAELSEGKDLTSDELTITATVEPAPTVTSVSPERGRILGGTSVTIRGTNFTKMIAVRFGEVDAASYTVISDTKIVAISPVGSAGTVHVTVTTKGGTSAENSDNRYTYARKDSSDSGPVDDTETHAVTFRDWDGTVLKIQIVEDGKPASAPQAPEREGYTFVGWEEVYDETGNMTMVAKYTANTYGAGIGTITFDSNGGNVVEGQKIPYGGNIKDPNDPVRDGYTFGGWYLDAGLTQKYDFTSDVAGNVTLYAKWIANGETVQPVLPLETEFTFASGNNWECMTENFTVRGISSEGVQITWTSSDPDVIRMEQGDDGMIGIVTRPQGHDASVVLTITATEGDNTVSRTFLLIVKQEGVSKEETRAETGRTASAQSGNSAGSEPIYRSALDNGTKMDSVILTADTVQKLIEQGGVSDSVAVTIGDSADDPANEYTFEAPSDAVMALSQNGLGLTLMSPAGTVEISAEEVERAAQSGTTIFFRIVQAQDEAEEAEEAFLGDSSVFSTTDTTGKVFGVPKRIETNLQDLAAAVTLPVKGLSEEQMADEAFLKTLGVYVEHSAGTTELVDGTLVYEDNEPVGIRFEINGFSRFQVVSLEGAAVAEPAEATPSPWIWIACAAAGAVVLITVFLNATRRKKESREDARS